MATDNLSGEGQVEPVTRNADGTISTGWIDPRSRLTRGLGWPVTCGVSGRNAHVGGDMMTRDQNDVNDCQGWRLDYSIAAALEPVSALL